VDVRCKALVCGHSRSGIAGSKPAGDMNISLWLGVECCQVEVSATGRSHVYRSPTKCGGSQRDRKASTIRRS
jgi:hypothetical protein